ncbi:bifunctional MaoC family dehydratase N-terminal/OB-fold nucleic acid binding domain-containing protein [Jatrophihabitans sp.]|uniref:bifunctional MaoC family dehydratase N-terminal/OB-fold nucleic acid binding domain-containing protein n=1 Tax=Jatrophihabitans sp. TaxID=1932789 RepID=UPI0030C73149
MPAEFFETVEKIKAMGESGPRAARDPVNLPMINNWTEAIGDANPRYTGPDAEAPPAMIQVWTMNGLHGSRSADDPLGLMMAELDARGFESVVATNCDQVYHRRLRLGERLTVTTKLETVIGPKTTGLGEGWFVTTRNIWYSGEEPVAEMVFRVLKFKPAPKAPPVEPVRVTRPMISLDTRFFWDGTQAGELRIQRCPACGTLRHPPGPMCPSCGHESPEYVVASGRGEIFSYVVHHHPAVPGKKLPIVIALVELEEGVRMLGELLDCDPAEVSIGSPVTLALTRIDDDLTLPFWRLASPNDQRRLP